MPGVRTVYRSDSENNGGGVSAPPNVWLCERREWLFAMPDSGCVDVGEGNGHRGKGALNSYPLMLLNVFVFNFHLRLLLVCVYGVYCFHAVP
ncbi:hypothetical protein Ddc_00242 [Ditylenchus destructor]|nr:hypothetical protein Ddc_00242 [Ditylenchus destructor]